MSTRYADPDTAMRSATAATLSAAAHQASLMTSLRTLASHSASREDVLADAARISGIMADLRRATTMRAPAVTTATPALRPVAHTLPPVA